MYQDVFKTVVGTLSRRCCRLDQTARTHTSEEIHWQDDPCIGPQTGGRPISWPQLPRQLRRGWVDPGFRRIYFLAGQPDPGAARNEFLSTVGCSGLDSQLLGTILRPFPTIFGSLGPGPLAEYLTHFQILEIQFFSNSPRDYAH